MQQITKKCAIKNNSNNNNNPRLKMKNIFFTIFYGIFPFFVMVMKTIEIISVLW